MCHVTQWVCSNGAQTFSEAFPCPYRRMGAAGALSILHPDLCSKGLIPTPLHWISSVLSFDEIHMQILQQWERGQVFPFQAFIMLQFSWFSKAVRFMKINAILPDCFLCIWCALMHYENSSRNRNFHSATYKPSELNSHSSEILVPDLSTVLSGLAEWSGRAFCKARAFVQMPLPGWWHQLICWEAVCRVNRQI